MKGEKNGHLLRFKRVHWEKWEKQIVNPPLALSVGRGEWYLICLIMSCLLRSACWMRGNRYKWPAWPNSAWDCFQAIHLAHYNLLFQHFGWFILHPNHFNTQSLQVQDLKLARQPNGHFICIHQAFDFNPTVWDQSKIRQILSSVVSTVRAAFLMSFYLTTKAEG